MALPIEEVRRIALETAEGIFGASRIDRFDVSVGPDWADSISYFLDFVVEQDLDRDVALEGRLKLRREVRDQLVAAGDETYPYVRVLNRAVAPAGG